MEAFFLDTIGRIVWAFVFVIANWTYLDFRRVDERGFKRFVAFWLGWPLSFLTKILVENGSQPRMKLDDQDLGELVKEIRRDRLLRGRSDGERALASPSDLESSRESS